MGTEGDGMNEKECPDCGRIIQRPVDPLPVKTQRTVHVLHMPDGSHRVAVFKVTLA